MATIESVKAKIQGLIDTANATTGKADKDLTSAMDSMILKVESGIGDAMNIAYGDNPPKDTSKLWVKTSKPNKVIVSPITDSLEVEGDTETLELLATEIPSGINDSGTARVGDKIYLCGYAGSFATCIFCFEISSQVYTTLPITLPTAMANSGCAAVGTKIYLFGGMNGSTTLNTVVCFDTESQGITTLPVTLPSARYRCAASAVGTKIYVFGGYPSTNQILCFDATNETLETLTTVLPQALYGSCSASIGQKIYVFGGRGSSGYLNTIYCYDAESNQISTLSATLPYSVQNATCASTGTKIYVFGGEGNSTYSHISCFDSKTKTAKQLSWSLPEPASGICCASDGATIYLLGGNYKPAKKIYRFTNADLIPLVAENELQVVVSESDNIFSLIRSNGVDIKVGTNGAYKGNAESVGEYVESAVYHDGAWVTI